MEKWIVYQHKNKITNKSYIGITSRSPHLRWKNGNGYTNHPKFYPAICKYGWDSFEHIILKEGLSQDEACEWEKFYIKYFNSYLDGYNASEGGESGSNGCNKELKNREKISKGMKKYLKEHPDELQKRIQQLRSAKPQARIDGMKKYYASLSSEQKSARMNKIKQKVLCIETQQIFNSMKEAADWCRDSS